MNFFEHQNQARRASGWLLLLFALAVLAVCGALNLVAAGIWSLYTAFTPAPHGWRDWFVLGHWLWLSLALVAVILGGSLLSLRRLWGHGDLLALHLGADNIGFEAADVAERRLINVVEEMAIASGLPVPSLWLLRGEPGINAFVAGTGIDDVALVMTQGGLEQLDRDELQGVVAHEFSHIQHHDMRLNLQLTAVLAGLENLSQGGLFLMRTSPRIGAQYGLPAVVGGFVIFLIGSFGWFCGRLLRAAFSRQREFLADASAVQYTRNPQGIARALARIRDSMAGARIRNRHVETISHFCFALPLSGFAANWLASHPPLTTRIQRIDRYFDLKQRSGRLRREAEGAASALSTPAGMALPGMVGLPGEAALAMAVGLLQALPDPVRVAAHSAERAQELACSLLLDEDDAVRARQLDSIRQWRGEEGRIRVGLLFDLLRDDLDRRRLMLLDLLLPQLRALPPDELQALRRVITELSAADGRLSLFELLLATLVRQQLGDGPAPRGDLHRYGAVAEELCALLWALIRLSPQALEADRRFLQTVMGGFVRQLPPLPAEERLSPGRLLRITDRLNRLVPLMKAPVLQACHDCVSRDGNLDPAEAEMLRVLAALLRAPAGAPRPTGGP